MTDENQKNTFTKTKTKIGGRLDSRVRGNDDGVVGVDDCLGFPPTPAPAQQDHQLETQEALALLLLPSPL